ncbi:MAG: hypothetical protein WC511_04795 [Candidatus Pacearchaeota archaeon]|jgi:hypothetical protein
MREIIWEGRTFNFRYSDFSVLMKRLDAELLAKDFENNIDGKINYQTFYFLGRYNTIAEYEQSLNSTSRITLRGESEERDTVKSSLLTLMPDINLKCFS